MFEHTEEVQKIKDYLKKKGLQLSESETEKIAQNLYELGLFLMRLKIKQHSQSTKPVNLEAFESTETDLP